MSGERSLGAPVEVWGFCLQKRDKYKQFAAVKCFSTQVCCQVYPSSPLHLSPKKLLICANPMTRHGRGRVGTCPPIAMLLAVIALVNFSDNRRTLFSVLLQQKMKEMTTNGEFQGYLIRCLAVTAYMSMAFESSHVSHYVLI